MNDYRRYELLTPSLFDLVSDEIESDDFYTMQDRKFADTLGYDPWSGSYHFRINGNTDFFGTMGQMWDCYAEKDGANLVKFTNGNIGYVAYNNGCPVTYIEIVSVEF